MPQINTERRFVHSGLTDLAAPVLLSRDLPQIRIDILTNSSDCDGLAMSIMGCDVTQPEAIPRVIMALSDAIRRPNLISHTKQNYIEHFYDDDDDRTRLPIDIWCERVQAVIDALTFRQHHQTMSTTRASDEIGV